MKAHNKQYALNRIRGNESATTKGRQLTIVVTSTTIDTVYYRLLSSSSPYQYHFTAPTNSPLQPHHFQPNQSYGINTLSRNGKYLWMSTFPLMTHDVHAELQTIDQDKLLDLLVENDFSLIQDLYIRLKSDFNKEELTPDQVMFIEDVEDVVNYWKQKGDFRHHFLVLDNEVSLTTTTTTFVTDDCALFA